MVVTAPPLVADLFRAGVPGFEVVGELAGRAGLAEQVARLRPDLVVIGLARGEGTEAVAPVLLACPGVAAMTLSGDGTRAVGHELHIQSTDLTDARPGRLAEFVRGAADWRGAAGAR